MDIFGTLHRFALAVAAVIGVLAVLRIVFGAAA